MYSSKKWIPEYIFQICYCTNKVPLVNFVENVYFCFSSCECSGFTGFPWQPNFGKPQNWSHSTTVYEREKALEILG